MCYEYEDGIVSPYFHKVYRKNGKNSYENLHSNYYATSDKQKLHDDPHYTEDTFREPKVIWGLKHNNLLDWYKAYFNYYYDNKYELKSIMAGWNLSSGYSYLIFGYSKKGEI